MPPDARPINRMPPLCIGHSHLRCVQVAALDTGAALRAINFWDDGSVIHNSPEDPVLNIELQREVRAHPGALFSFVGGGAHTVIALASHPRRYDFVLPEDPDLPVDPRAELVPADAVRAVLEREATPYLKLMRHLRSLVHARLVHVEPPPPCPDNESIAPHMPWSLFPGMLQEVAPRWLRYKAWRLHSKIVSDWCAVNDIAFLPVPAVAADASGFLRQEYFQDGVHANAAYGRLLLGQMQELA